MSVRPFLEYPHPALRERSAPVAEFDGALHELLEDLGDTVRATASLGLAAPQIGVSRRVLVLDFSGGREAAREFVNPVLRSRGGLAIAEERCLSVPGLSGNTLRAARVEVEACDRHGVRSNVVLEGMPAVCLQHEIDHLDGRLFTSHLFWWRRFAWWVSARRTSRRPLAAAR
jgi:peptide deformylase